VCGSRSSCGRPLCGPFDGRRDASEALPAGDDLIALRGGKRCLHLKRVDEADSDALRDIIARSNRAASTSRSNDT